MRRSIALMPAMIMVSIAGLLLTPTLSQSRGGDGQVTKGYMPLVYGLCLKYFNDEE